MDGPSVSLANAGDDREYVEALLEQVGLPTSDLPPSPTSIYVARAANGSRAGERVGIGGLERHGDAGLLRSLAVEEAVRDEGYGRAICRALEDRARDDDFRALYLLTTTSPDFFAGLGYAEIDREAAPAPIRASTQFAEVCSSSATCMRKRL